MRQTPVIARGKAPKQSGFGLLELMLAATIAAGITLGYLYNQSRQSAIHQAQSQAGYYQMVSDAVAKYMANNYDQLKAITQPKTCSEPRLFTEATDATAAPAPTGCGIQAMFLSGSDSSPIANGLQPTLTELKTTGYLDANFSNSFLWPTQLTMYAASGVSTGSSYAAPEYRVQIQAWCNGSAPANDTVCDKPVLHSLVYNAQPFAANTHSGFVNYGRLDKLLQARTTLGANAFMSYEWALKKDAFLYSDGNKNQLPNVLKFTSGSSSGIGVEGVLALQATYMPAQTSPTPTPPPTPTPTDIVWKDPFTACDIATDANTVALAKSSRARVVKGATLAEYYLACEIFNIYLPAFRNTPLGCKANNPKATTPFENYSPSCSNRIMPVLSQCETNPKGGSTVGNYCWQPLYNEVAGVLLGSSREVPATWDPEHVVSFLSSQPISGDYCEFAYPAKTPVPLTRISNSHNPPGYCKFFYLTPQTLHP